MLKPIKTLLTLALALCLALSGTALAARGDRGRTDLPPTPTEALTWAVQGEYRELTWAARAASLPVLLAVTEADLAAAELTESRARYAWYGALITCLRAKFETSDIPLSEAEATIELLLSDDDRRERQQDALYRTLTDADKAQLAADSALPLEFVQFIAKNDDWDDFLKDRWYDDDWYEADD